MEPGEKYEKVPRVTVVYISEHDFLKGGKTIYHMDHVVRETGELVSDGYSVVFVNTAVDDGSDIADLMRCMLQKEVRSKKFPVFTKRMEFVKDMQGGLGAVCKVMEEYAAEKWEQGRLEGIRQERQKTDKERARAEAAEAMVAELKAKIAAMQ